MAPLCALFTDFPGGDPYVGVVKAVILGRCPEARFLDLAHGLPAGDVRWGAFLLGRLVGFVPAGTVVLAVIDPGVGTARRILAAEAGPCRLVGPDNGLLSAALDRLAGPERRARVVAVDSGRVRAFTGTETFHARDIMAPAVARLLRGEALEGLGRAASDPVRLEPPVARRAGDRWEGEVVGADGYGNLITSLPGQALSGPPPWRLELAGRDVGPLRRTFGEVERGRVVAVVGSLGLVEIAVREGSARERLGACRGAPVVARPAR